MSGKFLEYLSKEKTRSFLILCLLIHLVYAILFNFLKIYPLSFLNVVSTLFYISVLFGFKKNQDFYIVFTYFEILTFSLISELCTGGSFYYIFYVVGMIFLMVLLRK